MKRQTEWAVIAALVLFMSFTPGFAPVRTLLSMPMGRLVALVAIVYVYKYVSPVIALLLAIHVARCTRMGSVWEGVDETLEPTEMCECDGGFTYNSGTKMCEKVGAEPKKPIRCACIPGEEWDATEKKCKQKTVASAPPPAEPPASMPSSATGGADLAAVQAQAASAPPSSVPQTTGAAAATLAASAPPPASTTAPPVPEKFTPRESTMTRGNLYSPW